MHQISRVGPEIEGADPDAAIVELDQEHQDRESELLAQISDLDDMARSYEERLNELSSTNPGSREPLCNQEAGFKARVDAVQRQIDAALQHQANLTVQIAALQGELQVAVAAPESRAAAVAERDASIALATTQLVRALENETVSSLAAA
jgi:chromosome segregation ATPase